LILGLVAERALSPAIEPVLGWFDLTESASGPITVALALAIGTSLQLVLGELVPKNIAISYPWMLSSSAMSATSASSRFEHSENSGTERSNSIFRFFRSCTPRS
jgi:CBS domain containing-hemolysin-like protein